MTSSVNSLGQMPSTPLDTSAATTYTDLNGLASLKKDPSSVQSINAVAQQVEAMFLQMMLKSMRDANMGDELDGGGAVGMYQDMFDKQIALSISQHQDIGIGAMLKRQLSGRGAAVPAKASKEGSAAGTAGVDGVTGAARAGAEGVAPDAAAQSGAPAQTPAEFVSKVMPSIERAAGELGLDPRGLLAQAALETGWGQRMPRTADGAPSHNLFGIKAGEEWTGARATADTVEFSHGVATPRRAAFRAYGSVEESVRDFAALLKNSPRYRDVMAAGGDLQAYVGSVGKSGYASDPAYANKLNQILNSGALQAALISHTAKL